MKLEVGKYYRTWDGRKVGPMRDEWSVGQEFNWHQEGHGWLWSDNGESYSGSKGTQIIAEWTDTPEVGTLKEIGAQVGDVVREANFPNKKVIAYHDGEPEPWVLECQETKEIDYWAGDYVGWRIISRAQPGPVRTVTRTVTELVFGDYGIVSVEDGAVCMGYWHPDDGVDTLTDAIQTLTSIRDAMQADATA